LIAGMFSCHLPTAVPVKTAGIEPVSIAFDIDGVIADTMTLFLDIARDEFDIHGIRYEDITAYNLADCIDMAPELIDRIIVRLLNGGYRARLRPIPGAPEVLQRLVRRSGTVLLVTARPHVGPISDFIHSIMTSDPKCFDIVATGSFDAKAEVLKLRNITHFVEDRLETCFTLAAAGITPVLFAQPWNREPHPFIEVSSWQEIEELICW
jgi:5'(3')-deoxyribonucleotidase